MIWEAYGEYRGARKTPAFLRYCIAKYNREQGTLLYKTYVTDTLQAISKNCIMGYKKPEILQKRFIEILHPIRLDEPTETIEETKERIGLVLSNLREKWGIHNDTI